MRARGLLMSALIGACAFAPSCTNETEATGVARDSVIYGEDDRADMFELAPDEPAFEIGTSAVAMMVEPSAVKTDGARVWIEAPAWEEEQGLCDGVRFAAQPAAAACTALAVIDDLVLTAGHCARLCSQTRFVFGWWYDGPGQLRDLTEEDVYDCVDVVIDEIDDTGVDYAWLRLDRPRATASVTLRVEAPQLDERVSLVSFPSGIPMKVDLGGRVTAAGHSVFRSSLDAFGGSSGGPVLDEEGEVLGVLGGGAADLTTTEDGCAVPVELASGGMERATTTRVALEGLCAIEPASSLCDVEEVAREDLAGCSAGPHALGRRDPFAWPRAHWLLLGAICGAWLRRAGDRGRPRV